MTTLKEVFISRYGNEPQRVTKNFVAKSLGTNYNVKDALVEFCDNALDAKSGKGPVVVEISTDEINNTLVIKDNGTGVSDPYKMFTIGGTDKETCSDKIGKYGIGVLGATSAIASKCRFNGDNTVEVCFESWCGGRHFKKMVCFMPDDEMLIGETKVSEAPDTLHGLTITFNNVKISSPSSICKYIVEVFEEPILKNRICISFDGRGLGCSNTRTFIGDEIPETIKVGDFTCEVKYRIIGGVDKRSPERNSPDSGLRVYDRNSGRMLYKSTSLWDSYSGKKHQPNVCGLRAAVYIDSSLESYHYFGVSPAKNMITKDDYHKRPEFANLRNRLREIYHQASKNVVEEDKNFTIGDYTFMTNESKGKLNALYRVIPDTNMIVLKNKYSQKEVACLIDEIEKLKKSIKYGKKCV